VTHPSSSLIISTYNWPVALDLVLLSVSQQSRMPDEILVADDGSGPETKELVDRWKTKMPVPLKHIWHEDDGFRVSAIRNQAVCQASNEYIIQVDGDMILEKHFIQDHMKMASKNSFFIGSRVLLSPEKTTDIQSKKNIRFGMFSDGIKNRINAIRLPALSRFFISPKTDGRSIVHEVRGCNMSYWREDFKKINGYNENFIGWGREDSEIGIRFVNAGVIKKKLKFCAIQYHQYHTMRSRDRLNINDDIMEKTIENKITYCDKGMDSHCPNS